MQESREAQLDNPLRSLTEAQFMALGGNAVVYVKLAGKNFGVVTLH